MAHAVYDLINQRIMTMLEAGTIPWRKPWNGSWSLPRNLVSKKTYRGLNQLLLANLDFESPYFMTFKQAKRLGGSVRRGEKGTPVIFWTWIEKKESKDKSKDKSTHFPLLRTYTVFNLEQCEGITAPEENQPEEFDPLEEGERIIESMPQRPEIKHRGSAAYYQPSKDQVTLPQRRAFPQAEDYYSTAFHELTHATGHESRLARTGILTACRFGSEPYGKEELIAELGAAYLCAETGIAPQTLEGSAAYLQGWLEQLKNDRRLIFQASSAAQKAVSFILNRGEVLVNQAA